MHLTGTMVAKSFPDSNRGIPFQHKLYELLKLKVVLQNIVDIDKIIVLTKHNWSQPQR